MLWNSSAIEGYTIAASDGDLGTISDLLFDDATWRIRWLVVDTGNWLPGRKVLLPPSVLGQLDPGRRVCPVKLTMQQVKDSPAIDTDLPVSRQMETNLYDHYGWSPYWGAGLYMGGFGYAGDAMAVSPMVGAMPREAESADTPRNDDDPHLRSVEAVTGYHIHASDGEIGHLKDFLVDDADWSIHYLVVDTTNWWPGKLVLISPRSASDINWADRLVNLDVDRQRVKDSPPYDAATTVDGTYEQRFHDYYGEIRATDQF
jgi:sporulation protein YlmC with PRC-barrel domain